MEAPLWLKLDPKTLLFSTSLLCLFMSLVSLAAARLTRGGEYGFRDWAISMGCGALALILYFFRGDAPGLLTYAAANGLILWLPAFALRAYARLFEVPMRDWPVFTVPAIGTVIIFVAFALDAPRAISQAIHPIAVALQLAWTTFVLFRYPVRRTPAVWVAVFITGAMGATFAMRAALVASGEARALSAFAGTLPHIGVLAYGVLFVVASSVAFLWLVSERQQREYRDRARRDGLTGLYNRAAFFELAGDRLQSGVGRYAIAMVDIDFFKRVNDQHGHQAGDLVLTHAAQSIASLSRSIDIAGRYGGEEFCIFLPECDREQALRYADRLVEAARQQSVRLRDGGQCLYTLSIGVEVSSDTSNGRESIEDVINRADQALYAAKHGGRDRALSYAGTAALHGSDSARLGIVVC